MSERRERVEQALPEFDAAWFDRLEEWYHVPVVAVLLGFMLWNRAHNWKHFVSGDDVLFSGNDAWYHFRQTSYTVNNWPATMAYDPWTGFPVGKVSGQFGTLFDQLVATAALVVGLGDPSGKTVALTLLFAPAVFGTLAAIPAYFIGRRLGGRFGGIVSVLVLALSTGPFLRRGIVGFSDHNIAEVLFHALAVLLVLIAVAVAEREKPVYELLVEREWDALRRPAGWAALAGMTIALYLWVWPPGVLIVGILGVYLVVKLSADYVRGQSPDHVAFAGATALLVTAALALIPFSSLRVTATDSSILQPGLAVAIAAGAVFMAWLAREWDARDQPRLFYPVAIVTLIALGVGVVAVALPDLFSFFVSQFMRVVGFGASATVRTVGEAQPVPLSNAGDRLYGYYGLTFVTAAIGMVLLLARTVRDDTPRGDHLFVLVWSVFLAAAALSQVRFNYYFVLSVAALNAYLAGVLLRFIGVDAGSIRRVQPYQVLSVLVILLVVTGPLTVRGGSQRNAVQYADSTSFPGEVQQWDDSLQWLRNNTPPEGTYGGGGEAMPYFLTVPRQDDYDYPDGAYGVISWWDYGHFITVRGERIPVANPFQQHARLAANFLLATNESVATDRLVSDDGERTRYVMIDWKMADPSSRKFTAPIVFYDAGNLTEADVLTHVFSQQGRYQFTVRRQRYYESMRARLYYFHGSAIDPSPVVVDYDRPRSADTRSGQTRYAIAPPGPNATGIRRFENMSRARAFVERDGSAQIGGIGQFPSQRVPALEHFRLVRASTVSAFAARRLRRDTRRTAQRSGIQPGRLFATQPTWVKTFEYVPGARVEGNGPPNTTVRASVRMRMPTSNTSFVYRQDTTTGPEGGFTMTLPYATTGYDEWGVAEGYTNVTVRAAGPYRFSTRGQFNETGAILRWNATADVPEGAVIGEDERPVRVDLERSVVFVPEGSENGTNASNGGANASALEPPASRDFAPAVRTDGGPGPGRTGSPAVVRRARVDGP